MLNISPELLEQMKCFNTVVAFFICVVLVAFCYGSFIYQLIDMIVTFIKFIIKKINNHKKGADTIDDSHTEH